MICIKTLQESDGERLDPIELETPGKFGVINGKYYIKYEESEMTGFPDTTTTLKIWKDNVVVSRKGKFMPVSNSLWRDRSCYQHIQG